MSTTKKTVKIKENALVDLIDNIVNEAVAAKKNEWISEQAAKGNIAPLLESQLKALTAKVEGLIAEGKK